VSSCCGAARPPVARGRSRALARWLLPSVALALVPKCPLCLMAWAAWAGLGLSVTMATHLRFLVLGACVTALLHAAWRMSRRARGNVGG
jgi:hypothetical protein